MGAAVQICRAEHILDLRHRILRAGLPSETARFEGDEAPSTVHFCATLGDGRVVGCVSLMRCGIDGADAWQLRGMAVEPDMQRAGVGRLLLREAEAHAKKAGPPHLWCNARVSAANFYERHGWVTVSKPFDIPNAGPHVRMTREL